MRKMKQWMMAAILTPAALLTSCTDNIDNPGSPTRPAGETAAQTAFWDKFENWQTDSCTLGDDFYMHMLHNFWWNPEDIYPDGMISYAGDLQSDRVSEMLSSTTDADVKILRDVCDAASEDGTTPWQKAQEMLKPRVDELWQNATTMEQAMEAWGRATVAGYNSLFSPVVKVVTGQAAWVMDEGRPFYYDDRGLSQLGKQELEKRRAYRGGQPIRRAAGQADANLTAFVKGLGLGLSADELVWEKEAKTLYESMAKTFTTVEAVKKEIETCVYMYDGLLISDDWLTAYNNVTYTTTSGKQVKLRLTRSKLMSNIKFLYGSLYVVRDFNKKFITASMKSQYTGYCEDFRAAFQKRLENNTWLSAETRANALDKLKNMEFFVATEPDATPDVATPKLKNEGIISLVRQLRQARLDTYKWMIGRSRREVIMLLSTFDFGVSCLEDNAYYDRATNAVFINPSNLLAPYIQDGDEDALRLAVLGSTIGHELTHGFDNGGRLYDKNGAYKNWWTPADTTTFNTYSQQLVDNYSELLMMPWADKTLYDNGKNTLGENIADIGGCCLSLDILLSKHPEATPEQQKQLTKRYFQGWAIAWSGSYDLEFAKSRYYDDEHSQLRERCNGVVRNINAWYDAYDIKSGTLYLEPAKRVAIW
ncbi:MAG: hypothetical protein IJG46_00350 [Prevotella sp.]|nr:hypothetical protein [Prevotella sp.]